MGVRSLTGKIRRAVRGRVSVEVGGGLPRLVLPEEYEGRVTWTLRALTVLGLGTSVFAFSSWRSSLGAAVLLLALEQLFEKAVFRYTSWFMQPMPDFDYQPERWVGMGFGTPPSGLGAPNIICFGFDDLDYASRFFGLISAWNYGESEDRDGNIRLTFLWEDESSYHVMAYPSLDRRSVTEAKHQAEAELSAEKVGKEHFQLVFQFVLCKGFQDRGNLRRFLFDQAANQRPFLLAAGKVSAAGQMTFAPDIEPILMHDLRSAHWADLDRDSFEAQFREVRGF